MKKAVIIANPVSGSGEGKESAERLKERLEASFDNVVIKIEDHDGRELAKQAAREKVDSLFVIGGDGTLNEVANGLAKEEYRPKLGFLPGGTNNTYVRLLGYPTEMDQAIEAIDLDHTEKVDIGRVNDSYFLYYVAFGQMLEATTGTTSEEKKTLGGLAYVKNIVQALPQDDTFEVKIETDEGTYEGPASHVFVMLSNRYGNSTLAKSEESEKDLSNGDLFLFIERDSSFGSKLSAITDMMMGSLEENDSIEFSTVHRLTITSDEADHLSLDIDGNPEGHLPAEIEILPRHLDLYLPEEKSN